jgi:hypothetical protein
MLQVFKSSEFGHFVEQTLLMPEWLPVVLLENCSYRGPEML